MFPPSRSATIAIKHDSGIHRRDYPVRTSSLNASGRDGEKELEHKPRGQHTRFLQGGLSRATPPVTPMQLDRAIRPPAKPSKLSSSLTSLSPYSYRPSHAFPNGIAQSPETASSLSLSSSSLSGSSYNSLGKSPSEGSSDVLDISPPFRGYVDKQSAGGHKEHAVSNKPLVCKSNTVHIRRPLPAIPSPQTSGTGISTPSSSSGMSENSSLIARASPAQGSVSLPPSRSSSTARHDDARPRLDQRSSRNESRSRRPSRTPPILSSTSDEFELLPAPPPPYQRHERKTSNEAGPSAHAPSSPREPWVNGVIVFSAEPQHTPGVYDFSSPMVATPSAYGTRTDFFSPPDFPSTPATGMLTPGITPAVASPVPASSLASGSSHGLKNQVAAVPMSEAASKSSLHSKLKRAYSTANLQELKRGADVLGFASESVGMGYLARKEAMVR